MKEQDFYGLRTIKVPLKRHGLLTELIDKEKQSKKRAKANDTSASFEPNAEENYSDSESQSLLVRTLSIRDACGSQSAEAANFLHKMDKDIKSILSLTKSQKDSLEEVVASMTCKRIHPLQRQTSWFSGADCGIRWWSVLIGMVIVVLVTPLMYFLYFEYVKPGS